MAAWAIASVVGLAPTAVYSQDAPDATTQDERATEAPTRNSDDDPLSWTKGYSMIVTRNTTIDEANATVDLINSNGGQVALVVSPRLMFGWAPDTLVGQSGIISINRKPATSFKPNNLDEADSLTFFNEVARGEWRNKKQGQSDHNRVVDYPSDVIEGPATSGTGFIGNGSGLAGSASPGNSDMMVGKANFNAIFIESNGGIDPNTYSWTCADLSTIVSEISASLSFWSSRAANYGVPLTWVITYHRPAVSSTAGSCAGTSSVQTSYEPIRHASTQDSLWISQIMCNFGNCSGDKFARTTAFNAARRTAAKTNWAVTSFIGYNPSPAPTNFTDGYFAYAYRAGYYSQLLFRNDGWAITQYDLVNAHETGHLFGTFDEYASSNCNNCFTGDIFSKNVVNGNCVNCNASSVPCIMRNNELALSGYTPGQVGWGLDVNSVQTTPQTSFTEKTNWVPGQAIRYNVNVDVPGRPGECVEVHSRWYRQFQANLTESESFITPCQVKTGGNWNISLNRTVPAGAQFGEASVQVQLEFKYASPNMYGKGIRASSRGRFFVLQPGANAIPTSPVLTSNEGPQATLTSIPQ